MIARWLGIGFVLWFLVTMAFKFVGDAAFQQGIAGISWLLLAAPAIMFALTFWLLRLLKVSPPDRGEAAAIFAFPGLLIGIYEINSFDVLFRNLSPSLSTSFAQLMYACYAASIIAGIASSRLRVFGGGKAEA